MWMLCVCMFISVCVCVCLDVDLEHLVIIATMGDWCPEV